METTEDLAGKELATLFPTAREASYELACCALKMSQPKLPELYLSDPHGEYETFAHIVRSGCGRLNVLIDRTFDKELSYDEKNALAALVCYPEEKMEFELAHADERAWMLTAIDRLVRLYNRARKDNVSEEVHFPGDHDVASLVEELRLASSVAPAVDVLMEKGFARDFVTGLCFAISELVTGRVHLVGDVYDRGPAPDLIMDEVEALPDIDIQWGNHDIVWMGASLGQRGCIAHVVRNCARYANLSILTDSYGIDIQPFVDFALATYAEDPCTGYALKSVDGLSGDEIIRNMKVQKAMAILQFKVEGQLIDENPSFGLEDRKLLHRIDREHWTIDIGGMTYPITDTLFPTVNWADPYALTPEEEQAMRALEEAFVGCEKLQHHMSTLLNKGSLYRIENGVLMFHACVPLNEDGSLMNVELFGKTYTGKSLFDAVEHYIREAFAAEDPAKRKRGADLLWYLWLGPGSPLFAKSKMATFEIYLIEDKSARVEVKNPFYSLLEDEDVLARIFESFGMDPHASRIVCGHTPVKVKDGANPVKCGGKLVIIDGGMSKAYQKTTGIGGFTLVFDDQSMRLATHKPFAGRKTVVETNAELHSKWCDIDRFDAPFTYAQTDDGAAEQEYIDALEELVEKHA